MTTVAEAGERAIIERIRARITVPRWVVVGPGDDAAVIEPERGTLDVLTTDALVEGVHFDGRFVPPEAIGHRALAANLSDLAAMGAQPRAALLSLVLPPAMRMDALEALLDGFVALADTYKVALIGGNVTRSVGPLMVDVTAIGSIRRRQVLTREGARPGDSVYVTGTVGDAALGLRLLQDGGGVPDGLTTSATRYLRPQPRVRAGLLLARNRVASSCMDLSDGLADAIRQVASASGVGMVLDAALLPIDPAVRAWHEPRDTDAVSAALAGGDDYELLFTVRPARSRKLSGVRSQLGDLPITRIGVVTKARDIVITDGTGASWTLPSGFEHFR